MEFIKTPVSFLQEFCAQQKCLPPHYEEIPLHSDLKSFRYVVGAFGYTAEGDGNSKKEAKHAACAQLIEYLRKTHRFKEYFTPAQVSPKPTSNAVSALMELCAQNNWLAQFNDDLPPTGPSHDPEFTAVCSVNSNETTGKAPTKKGARQLAAAEMLKILQCVGDNCNKKRIPFIQSNEAENICHQYRLNECLRQTGRFKEDVAPVQIAPAQLPPKPTFNAVSALLELCVQKMWPVAEFNDNLPSTGPPHDPKFTAICRVGSNEATGKAPTKKGARQLAAAEMLEILKRLDEDSNERPIPLVQYDEPEKIWRRYREWRRSDIKIDQNSLNDRHNNFLQVPNDTRKACYEILKDSDVEFCSHRDLVDRICKALGLKYKVKTIPNHRYQHKTFILEGDFDVVLVEHDDKLYGRVIDYFKTMLNFQYIAI